MLRSRVLPQVVVNALHQRVLRTYHHHVDGFLHAELLDGLEVVGLDGHVLATLPCPRIAGGYIQFLTSLTLCYLPCQRVLTAAAS